MQRKVNPPFCAAWLSVSVGHASGHVVTWLIRVVRRRIQPSRLSHVATSLPCLQFAWDVPHHVVIHRGKRGGAHPEAPLRKGGAAAILGGCHRHGVKKRGDEEGSAPRGLNVPRRRCSEPLSG
jgi:hypothetical protein